jgi:hypothetical protein
MRRRNFLKALCASPLALLAKKPKPELTVDQLVKCKDRLTPYAKDCIEHPYHVWTWTTGTSSNTAVWTYQQDYPLGTCKVDSSGQRWIYCKISILWVLVR